MIEDKEVVTPYINEVVTIAHKITKELGEQMGLSGMAVYFILWRLKDIWNKENAGKY